MKFATNSLFISKKRNVLIYIYLFKFINRKSFYFYLYLFTYLYILLLAFIVYSCMQTRYSFTLLFLFCFHKYYAITDRILSAFPTVTNSPRKIRLKDCYYFLSRTIKLISIKKTRSKFVKEIAISTLRRISLFFLNRFRKIIKL